MKIADVRISPAAAKQELISFDYKDFVIADDVTLTIDGSGVADFAAVGVPLDPPRKECMASESVITCSLGQVSIPNGLRLPSLSIQTRDDAKVGRKGTVKVTLTAKGIDPVVATSKITVVEPVDLSAGGRHDPVTVKATPGGTVRMPVTVTNLSQRPARGAVLDVVMSSDLAHAKRFKNCEYTRQAAQCRFTEELAPGVEYKLAESDLTVGADVYAPDSLFFFYEWNTPGDAAEYGDGRWFSGRDKPVRGTQGELRLVREPATMRAQQTDPARRNNLAFRYVEVTGENKADPAAVGTVVHGEIGSTVVAKVGVKNLGAARTHSVAVDVVVPGGTTVTAVKPVDAGAGADPAGPCRPFSHDEPNRSAPNEPGAVKYRCASGDLRPNEQSAWEFTLRVDMRIDDHLDPRKGATIPRVGSIEIVSTEDIEKNDRNAANNKAEIVVRSASDAGGAAGGTGGTAGGAAGGTGGGLPITGAKAGLAAGAGLALITVGGIGYLIARRRRTRFIA